MFKRLVGVISTHKKNIGSENTIRTIKSKKEAPKLNIPPIPGSSIRRERLKKIFLNRYFAFFWVIVAWHCVGFAFISLLSNKDDDEESSQGIRSNFRKVTEPEKEKDRPRIKIKVYKNDE